MDKQIPILEIPREKDKIVVRQVREKLDEKGIEYIPQYCISEGTPRIILRNGHRRYSLPSELHLI